MLTAVSDVDLVRSRDMGIVAALVSGRVDSVDSARHLVAVWAFDCGLQLALARVLGDHSEVGHVADSDALRLNAATVGPAFLGVTA